MYQGKAVVPMVTVSADDPRCPRCGHKVYHAEQMIIGGKTYHKACFTCRVCKVHLDSLNSNERDAQLYCRKCYGRAFGPRGYGFGMGAGTLSMTMTALLDANCTSVVHNPATHNLLEAAGEPGRHDFDPHRRDNPANYRFVKTNAHDNLITSNVPAVAAAHAYPRLIDDRFEADQRHRNNTHKLAETVTKLPPNVVSIIPPNYAQQHQRYSRQEQNNQHQYYNDPEAFLMRK